MPLFGKKDSGKKIRKDGTKDIDKQIINIEDKYILRQVLGKWVSQREHEKLANIKNLTWFNLDDNSSLVVCTSCVHCLQMSRSLHLIIIKTPQCTYLKMSRVCRPRGKRARRKKKNMKKIILFILAALSTQLLLRFTSFHSFEFN